MNLRILCSLAALLLLCSCGAQSAPSSSSQESSSSQPVRLDSSSSKVNPGCRVDLPWPLVMEGESTATDWTRWSATDLEGNPVDESILVDSRLTLVTVWSSYCSSCIDDLTALQEVYEAYGREDLNIVGIVASAQNQDGTLKETEPLLVADLQTMSGAQFLQLLPSDDLIAIKLKDITIVPETFLVDSKGNLVGESVIGPRTVFQFREMVDEALASLPEESSLKEAAQQP